MVLYDIRSLVSAALLAKTHTVDITSATRRSGLGSSSRGFVSVIGVILKCWSLTSLFFLLGDLVKTIVLILNSTRQIWLFELWDCYMLWSSWFISEIVWCLHIRFRIPWPLLIVFLLRRLSIIVCDAMWVLFIDIALHTRIIRHSRAEVARSFFFNSTSTILDVNQDWTIMAHILPNIYSTFKRQPLHRLSMTW